MKVVGSNLPPVGVGDSWFRRLLNRLGFYETMSGNGACPVYLERWTVAEAFGCGIYLHHFLGDDWAVDPHDHPRRFISIGLKGWYYEDVFSPKGELVSTERYQAPWARSFPAEHLHRVRAVECGDCWTLVIVLRKSRGWGFVKEGQWVPFRDYVFGGLFRKSCLAILALCLLAGCASPSPIRQWRYDREASKATRHEREQMALDRAWFEQFRDYDLEDALNR